MQARIYSADHEDIQEAQQPREVLSPLRPWHATSQGLYRVLQETRQTWLRKSCVTRCSHSVSGLPSDRRPEMPPWVVLWMYSGGARPPAHATQESRCLLTGEGAR